MVKQVLTLQHQYVRPASDDLSEMKLTEECKTLTGLCDDHIRNAQPLDHVLDDVSNVASCLTRPPIARSLKAKFHYTSWFGASSELDNIMEFGR